MACRARSCPCLRAGPVEPGPGDWGGRVGVGLRSRPAERLRGTRCGGRAVVRASSSSSANSAAYCSVSGPGSARVRGSRRRSAAPLLARANSGRGRAASRHRRSSGVSSAVVWEGGRERGHGGGPLPGGAGAAEALGQDPAAPGAGPRVVAGGEESAQRRRELAGQVGCLVAANGAEFVGEVAPDDAVVAVEVAADRGEQAESGELGEAFLGDAEQRGAVPRPGRGHLGAQAVGVVDGREEPANLGGGHLGPLPRLLGPPGGGEQAEADGCLDLALPHSERVGRGLGAQRGCRVGRARWTGPGKW
ncbi:hypothetical protein GA0115250_123851 [Streptomyces sp. BvitLS-983]|nr:hypothetical protein GA0115250_123851 [Streptomyces sp. BvitLS-983]